MEVLNTFTVVYSPNLVPSGYHLCELLNDIHQCVMEANGNDDVVGDVLEWLQSFNNVILKDSMAYYTDPNMRGYLADPEKVMEAREKLAQKYGYHLPDFGSDPLKDLLLMRKDPLQIFYGLEPGWIVNLKDRCILKPKDDDYLQYYQSSV